MLYIMKGFMGLTKKCAKDNKGIGVVELILILVVNGIVPGSRILCGNFRYFSLI
ncbi:MAG: hypothetical protein K6G27_13185 [Lachnospiraceae bacterium]|nr:hypothetical protein [Lachnospiraceae bacterium]